MFFENQVSIQISFLQTKNLRSRLKEKAPRKPGPKIHKPCFLRTKNLRSRIGKKVPRKPGLNSDLFLCEQRIWGPQSRKGSSKTRSQFGSLFANEESEAQNRGKCSSKIRSQFTSLFSWFWTSDSFNKDSNQAPIQISFLQVLNQAQNLRSWFVKSQKFSIQKAGGAYLPTYSTPYLPTYLSNYLT